MSEAESAESRSGAWARWGLLACLGLAAAAYRPLLWFQPERSLPEELEEWFFVPSDTIAPAVVLMSAWLLYRRWGLLRSLPDAPGAAWVGGLLLAGALAVHGWATYTGAGDLLVPSLMLTLLATAWLWKGRPAVRAVRLPVAFLIFAMPLPAPVLNEVVYQLQIGTTDLTGRLLYALGIPHFISGEQILRERNTFSVIEACSGLRSMETLTMVSILMMDLFRRRGLHAWLVVLAAAPVGFLLNSVRAVGLILNPHSRMAAVHNLQGVAILLSGLVILFLLDGLLEKLLPHEKEAPRPRGGEAGGLSGARVAALAACLGAAAAFLVWLPRWEAPPVPGLNASRQIAGGLGARLSGEIETDRLFLGSVGFREVFTRRFQGALEADPSVTLFLGVGRRAARGGSAVSPKTAIPGSGWIVEEEGWVVLEPDGRRVQTRVMRSGSDRQLVYHWLEGRGSLLEESLRSLLALDRSPWQRSEEVVVVRLAAPLEGAVERQKRRAEQVLVSFYRDLRPLLDVLEAEIMAGKRFS